MDPREYLDARWHALVRAAVDLSVPEEDAPALVQRVLARNERRIRRAEDPDPLVHEALRDEVLGAPPAAPHGRRLPRALALAASLVAVGAGVALTRPDPPPDDRLHDDQVPSLFGYDGATAQQLLEDRGLRVTLKPRRACEVLDRVLGSIPPAGAPYESGDDIVVYTSLPADVDCLSNYTDRETAWRLLDFANGRGPAPELADPTSAVAPDVLEALRDASAQVALVDERPLTYSLPAIRVTPTDTGHADSFHLLVRPAGGIGRGVEVEVVREDGEIGDVRLYASPSSS
ncbi:PASTA domain-containing protein [Nocardioides sp. SR21]|uniref:PASTA domain-containing protein n=1 Tax=Nocardioides sp. SR21 TaxID=2919501 RepID=UPI001FAA762F|nr:PASTA domain-containing protein [Nocardioides sp. SR21]